MPTLVPGLCVEVDSFAQALAEPVREIFNAWPFLQERIEDYETDFWRNASFTASEMQTLIKRDYTSMSELVEWLEGRLDNLKTAMDKYDGLNAVVHDVRNSRNCRGRRTQTIILEVPDAVDAQDRS